MAFLRQEKAQKSTQPLIFKREVAKKHPGESRGPEHIEITGSYRNFLFYPPPPTPSHEGRGKILGLPVSLPLDGGGSGWG
jgi:hypothetical protein